MLKKLKKMPLSMKLAGIAVIIVLILLGVLIGMILNRKANPAMNNQVWTPKPLTSEQIQNVNGFANQMKSYYQQQNTVKK